jgi:2,4-dienoyl-CoA reductase-like NADH-dependent reductase (Old Yellow Enzyme family)
MMVGGLRNPEQMEAFLRDGEADFMALCRPLIREPDLIERWTEGDPKKPDCISCNACFNALLDLQPLACAVNGKHERKPS